MAAGQGSRRFGRPAEVGDVYGGYVLLGQSLRHPAGLLVPVGVELGVSLPVHQGKRSLRTGGHGLPMAHQEDLGGARRPGKAQLAVLAGLGHEAAA